MEKDKIIQLVEQKEFNKAKELILKVLDDNQNDYELIKNLGLCNINLGCFDEAENNFKKLTELNKDDALALYYLAQTQIEKNNFENAKNLLLEVINLRENYLDAYKSLAVVYNRLQQPLQALSLEQKMLEINSQDPQIYDIMATTALESGNLPLGIEKLKSALGIDPDNTKYYCKLGIIYFAMGNIQGAINVYYRALESHPKDVSVLYNIGMAYIAVENFDEAYNFLKQAKENDTEDKESILNAFAISALKSRHYEDAVEIYKKLTEISNNKENYEYYLACAYDGIGDLEKAVILIEKLVTFNLNSIPLKLHLASIYNRLNRIEAAKILYADIISSGVANINILYDYAILCAKALDTDKAEEILKKIIAMDSNFALAYKDLAVIYLSRKLFDLSLENFKKAYELEPDNINIIFDFANYYHLMSDFDNAKTLYEKLLTNENLPINMLISIAENYLSINNINEAKKLLLKAIEKEPQNVKILYNLAQIYYHEKNYNNARQLLEDSYTLSPNADTANLLAKVAIEQGEYNQAYGLLNIVNLSVPNNISVLMSMAECKYKQKEYDNAKEHLQTVLKILPEYEDAVEFIDKINKEVGK